MSDSTKSLPSKATQGYCYFDIRDGKWWVDIAGDGTTTAIPSTTTSTGYNRMPLNAYKADKVESMFFGECSTAAGTSGKEVIITNDTFSLTAGAIIAVKFNNANTASNPTLKVNTTTAKNIYVNNTQITTSSATYGLLKGTVLFIYDGSRYNLIGNYYNSNTWVALSSTTAGYVTKAPNDTTKFLRGDATWAIIPTASSTTAGILKVSDAINSTASTVAASSSAVKAAYDLANSKTDTKVTQSASTTSSWRKLLLHATADNSSTSAVSTATNQVYSAKDISAQPSTGTIRATVYNIADQAKLQFNSTTNAIDFVFV